MFHSPSGQTHFLSQTAQDIVSLLQTGDCATNALHQTLLTRYAIDEDEDLRTAIAEVLTLLDGLGVIQARV